MPPLFIFPTVLFAMAVLALFSGIGTLWTIRHKRAGIFTAFIWSIFSGSIAIGFMTFAIFIYVTQSNAPLAIGIALAGILAVIGAGRLATL